MVLHLVVLLVGVALSVLELFKAEEIPHQFTMVDLSEAPAELNQPSVPAPAQPKPQEAPPPSSFEIPKMQPLHKIPDITIPEKPVESPSPEPPKPEPAPVRQPEQIDYRKWKAERDLPESRQVVTKPSRKVESVDIRTNIRENLRQTLSEVEIDYSRVASSSRDAVANYAAALRMRLQSVFSPPSSGLTAKVEFTVGADGSIGGVRIVRSSGDTAFDQSVLSAFQKVRNAGPPPGNPPFRWRMDFISD